MTFKTGAEQSIPLIPRCLSQLYPEVLGFVAPASSEFFVLRKEWTFFTRVAGLAFPSLYKAAACSFLFLAIHQISP